MFVLFDPEGVLTDSSACRKESWRLMAREQGITYDETLDELLQGMNAESRLEMILRRAHRGYSAAERLALLTRQNDLYEEQLLLSGDGILRPGAAQTLKALSKRRVKLGAVMTDGLPGQLLARVSIRPMFSVISRQEDFLSQLSDVQLRLSAAPNECLVVTAYPSGAKAARSLGMQALLCGKEDEQTVILQQIFAILPDFDSAEQNDGGNYAG